MQSKSIRKDNSCYHSILLKCTKRFSFMYVSTEFRLFDIRLQMM